MNKSHPLKIIIYVPAINHNGLTFITRCTLPYMDLDVNVGQKREKQIKEKINCKKEF